MILTALVRVAVSLDRAAEWQAKRLQTAVGTDGGQRVEIIAGGHSAKI